MIRILTILLICCSIGTALYSQERTRLEFGLGFQNNRYRKVLNPNTSAKMSGGNGFLFGARYAVPIYNNIWGSAGIIWNSYQSGFYSEKRESYGANWQSVELTRNVLSLPVLISISIKNKLDVGVGVQTDLLLDNKTLIWENTYFMDSGVWEKRSTIHNTDDMQLHRKSVTGAVFSLAYRFKAGPVELVPRYSFYYAFKSDVNSYTGFNSMRNMLELSINVLFRPKE